MTSVAVIVLSMLYLNVPAIMVRDFGLPFFIGAVVPLLLVIPLGYRVLLQREALRFPLALALAALLIGVQAFSAMFAMRPHESILVVQDWLIEGLVLAALIVNVFHTRKEVLLALNAIIGVCAAMGAIALFQQAAGLMDNTLWGFGHLDSAMPGAEGSTQRRLAGPIGETNRFAQILLVALPLALAFAMVKAGTKRLLYLAAAALIAGGIALSFSRGALLALVLLAPLGVALGLWRLRHIGVGLAVALLAILILPPLQDRVVSIGMVAAQSVGLSPTGTRNADGAARGRLTEMYAAGLMFVDHPLTGVGPGMAPLHYPEYAAKVGGNVRSGTRRSHNLFLQLAAETGLLGLTVFLLLVGLILNGLNITRQRFVGRDREVWAAACGLLLAMAGFLITSMFLHAAYIRYLWMLFGLCMAVSALDHLPVLLRFLHRILMQTADEMRAQL